MRSHCYRFANVTALVAGAILLTSSAWATETDTVTSPPAASATIAPGTDVKATPPVSAPVAPSPSATVAPTPDPKPAVVPTPSRDLALTEAISERLSQPADDLSPARKADREALIQVYNARSGPPLWVTSKGLTERAKRVVAEIRKADDYGLESSAFVLPALSTGGDRAKLSEEQLVDAELEIGLAALKYAHHARGGRMSALQLSKHLDRPDRTLAPSVALANLMLSAEPDAYLRSLHPKHRQFEMLRQELLKMRKGQKAKAKIVAMPSGPVLKLGTKHPHVALLRQRLKVPASASEDGTAGDPKLYDEELKKAVKTYQKSKGLTTDGVVGSGTRRALNNVASGNPQKLIVNMEQWRWMPDELGRMYIWSNIPEYRFRIIKDDKVIHAERIVVGKYVTPTPVFSDKLEMVIFQPRWGVPNSIKVKELWPSLRHSTSILRRQNLHIYKGSRRIDPESVDWSRTDPRTFSFIQPSGPRNALGKVKFRFPNKHQVYMHDTPSKHLFRSSARAYSHGCMRVRNPQRFAEVILAEDKGWSAGRVGSLMSKGGGENTINLNTHYPVHVTYFTAIADPSGKIKYFKDIYHHEKRIALGLAGKGHMVAGLVPHPVVKARKPRIVASSPGDSFAAWLENVFGDN